MNFFIVTSLNFKKLGAIELWQKEHLNKNVLILVGDQSSSCCIFGFLKFESLFGSIMQN